MVLLRQVVQRKNAVFIFSDDNPLITTVPIRTKYNKLKKIEFSADFQQGGMPCKDDLGFLQINQSHYDMNNWRTNLYMNRAFEKIGNKAYFALIPKIYNHFKQGKALAEILGSYMEALKEIIQAPDEMIKQIVSAAKARSDVIIEFENLVEQKDLAALGVFLESE